MVGFGEPSIPISDFSLQSLRLLSPVAAYINKREKELMKLFKKQLEEKTRMLQADIRNQKDAMEMMKEQLNTLKDSKFKVRDWFYVSSIRDRRKGKELVNRDCQ